MYRSVFDSPVMAVQMMTVINRLCCTFACKTYQIGRLCQIKTEKENAARQDEPEAAFSFLFPISSLRGV